MARILLLSALVSGLTLALALPVHAEPPTGSYVIDVGGDQSILLPTEIEDSACETADGVTVCIDGAIATDGSGAVTGSALMELSGDIEGELEATLAGSVRGSRNKTKVRLAMDMSGEASSGGITLDFEGKARFKCVDTTGAGSFLCRGRIKLCAFDAGKRIGCESERLDLELTDGGGPWQLRLLNLSTATSGAVTGNAEVTLATGQILTYDVSGKYSSRKDTAKLRLVGTGDAARSKLAFSKAVFEGSAVTDGKLAYRIAGQKGKVDPVLSGPAFIPAFDPWGPGHGAHINGGFTDANQDTANLFNGGSPGVVSHDGVIFFGTLDGASRERGRTQGALPQR